MAAIKRSKGSVVRIRDPKKEGVFKQLAALLGQAGFEVRRERLRTGFGFKVVSGSCRVNGSQVIFVDTRLNQDEQLEFLKSRAVDLGVPLPQ